MASTYGVGTPRSITPQESSAEPVPTGHPRPKAGGGGCPFHRAAGQGDVEGLRKMAQETLAARAFGDNSAQMAAQVLERALQLDPADPEGQTNLLLGQAYFQLERWGDAQKHLEVAAGRLADPAPAQKLLERAKSNTRTGVERAQIPPSQDQYTAEHLLAPPALFLREPEGLQPLPPEDTRVGTRLRQGFRRASGAVLGKVLETATRVMGRNWTTPDLMDNWDEASPLVGALKLAHVREELYAHTVGSTYPGELVGHQQPGQRRPEWTHRFRTATGAWTTDDPMEGAAGTEFQILGGTIEDQVDRSKDPHLPSAIEVSNVLLKAKGPRQYVPHLNALAISWIQPMIHDWGDHIISHEHGAVEMALPEGDPRRATYGVDHISLPNNTPHPLPQEGKHTYINRNTHWWDGSHIYGSDQATQDRLRKGPQGPFLADGKLRIDGDLLPLNPVTGIEDTGFSGNWWLGPALFHTLFVKNHNHICDVLKQAHPDFSSDQLFHTARLINVACMAKIHTIDWTTAVFPHPTLVRGMGANWWGLIEQMRKVFSKRRMTSSLEPLHPVLGGLAGGERDNHGVPHGFSEKFMDVYRFHDALPDALEVRPPSARNTEASVPLMDLRGTAVRELAQSHGYATLFNSFGHQHMAAMVANNYPDALREMSVDGNPLFDLGAADIERGRQRGVPTYTEFSRQMLFHVPERFEDLGCDGETVKELERLYGPGKEGVERLDFLVGCLVSKDWPKQFPMDMRRFAPFIPTASDRILKDPFFTEKFNARYYTKEGMELVEKANLKDLLLQHFPELRNTGLVHVNNAFEPWGTTAATHPEEHPLSAGSERY